MKLNARDSFYQRRATTRALINKVKDKITALTKEGDQVMEEHFAVIAPLLGCVSCVHASPKDVGKGPCCGSEQRDLEDERDGEQHSDDYYFRKDSNDAPICRLYKEGVPAFNPPPNPMEMLQKMMMAAKVKENANRKADDGDGDVEDVPGLPFKVAVPAKGRKDN